MELGSIKTEFRCDCGERIKIDISGSKVPTLECSQCYTKFRFTITEESARKEP